MRVATFCLLVLAACPAVTPPCSTSTCTGPLTTDGGSAGGAAGGAPGGMAMDSGVALATCPEGSILVIDTPDAGWARSGGVFSNTLYQVVDLPERPAGWVDSLRPSRLSARVFDAQGRPVANCEVRWSTASGNGWIFPDAPTTDATGSVRAVWTAGSAVSEQVLLSMQPAGGVLETGIISGSAQPHTARGPSIHLNYAVPERWDLFSVDVTPLTFPTTTYYAAIGFEGGYFGFQNRGPTNNPSVTDKWILFSVWDTAAGPAQLQDAGPMTCDGFSGEGTGRRCHLDFDWRIGGTYRFEVAYSRPAGTQLTEYTAFFTDLSTGVRRQLATLRHQAAVTNPYAYGFVEDWAMTGNSCLTTEERSANFHDIRYRRAGVWHDVRSVTFSTAYNEWHNEICANYFYGAADGGFLWSSGGDRRISRPKLHTETVAPVVTLP